MEIPVMIETVSGNGYRATGAGGISVGLTAEGTTAQEAIDRLTQQVRTRVNAGAKITKLNIVIDPEAPWRYSGGSLKDNPLYEQWREAMEENRLKLDEDPEAI